MEEQDLESYNSAKERVAVEESLSAGISSYLEIKELPKGHPAFDPKQESFGAFARKKIDLGTPIGEVSERYDILISKYVGVYLAKDKDVNSKYKLSFNSSCDIDARLAGNETRFINHYKGIRSTPNIKYEWVLFEEGAIALATTIEAIEQGS